MYHFRMGDNYLYYSKEEWNSKIHLSFQILEFSLGQKAISNTQNRDVLQNLRESVMKMGYYYTVWLDPDSQKLCTVIALLGKYQYLSLTMDMDVSPDIFQEKMFDLMGGLEFVCTYLNDLVSIIIN